MFLVITLLHASINTDGLSGESLWFLEAVTGVQGVGLAAPTCQETWTGGDWAGCGKSSGGGVGHTGRKIAIATPCWCSFCTGLSEALCSHTLSNTARSDGRVHLAYMDASGGGVS